MSEKLKPCPFCDSDRMSIEPDECWDVQTIIRCEECNIRVGFFDSEEEAIKVWNKRAAETKGE